MTRPVDPAPTAAPSAELPPAQPGVTSWHFGRMLTAWALAAVIGVLVVALLPVAHRPQWLVTAIGCSTLLTFMLQLGTAQREGFITRVSFSVAGSVLVIFVIDFIGFLLR